MHVILSRPSSTMLLNRFRTRKTIRIGVGFDVNQQRLFPKTSVSPREITSAARHGR